MFDAHRFVDGLLAVVMLSTVSGCRRCAPTESTSPQPAARAESAASVGVRITSAEADDRRLDVRYRVRNGRTEPIWLVVDEPPGWERRDDQLELSYARKQMQPGVEPFGYFEPKTRKLRPDETLERSATLRWRDRLAGMWNDRERANPPPGTYRLRVEIGYGERPEPDPDDTTGTAPSSAQPVELPTLRWQQTATSDPAEISISASPSPDGSDD